jgi:hypothetical protein
MGLALRKGHAPRRVGASRNRRSMQTLDARDDDGADGLVVAVAIRRGSHARTPSRAQRGVEHLKHERPEATRRPDGPALLEKDIETIDERQARVVAGAEEGQHGRARVAEAAAGAPAAPHVVGGTASSTCGDRRRAAIVPEEGVKRCKRKSVWLKNPTRRRGEIVDGRSARGHRPGRARGCRGNALLRSP